LKARTYSASLSSPYRGDDDGKTRYARTEEWKGEFAFDKGSKRWFASEPERHEYDYPSR
jgi:hypothetical protein